MFRVTESFAKSLKLRSIETGTIRKFGYGFLFVFHSNYGSVLYHFRHKPRYWLRERSPRYA